jgi:ATP-binding cassette subfamily C protein CydC
LATVLTGGAAAVSAGQRRRLLLARALLSHSAIVLLDEPTEHLDADSADAILRAVLTPGSSSAPIARSWSPPITCRPILAVRA